MNLTISTRHVTSLDDDQIDRAAEILTEAFKSDPLLPSMVGGDLSLSQPQFRAFITAAVVDGEAYFAEKEGEVVGISCWFGPGKEFLGSHKQREAGWNKFWNEGLSPAGRKWHIETYIPCSNALYSHSLPTPTSKLDGYHLALLGVLPAFQGNGIGAKLVREGQERARRQNALVCLDTYTDNDIAIYKHWGFQVGGAESMPSVWRDFVMTVMVWIPGGRSRSISGTLSSDASDVTTGIQTELGQHI